MLELSQNIQYLKGVGPNRIKLLNNIGIFNIEDLITYFPRNYEDRQAVKSIYEVIDGEEIAVKGKVMSRMSEIRVRRNLTIYSIMVSDDTSMCKLIWYNQPYLKSKFEIGNTYVFFGKVSKKFNKIEILNPVYDNEENKKNTGKIIPIYPLTYNLSQNVLRGIIESALNLMDNSLIESMPKRILENEKLCDINYAIKQIHFPNTLKDFEKARERLAFEELLIMQLGLLKIKTGVVSQKNGIQFSKEVKMSDVINKLPFRLTGAQLRVLEEIDNDIESNKIMNRLLQGDVGSGKTIVAIIALYKVVKSGYQGTIMAPTSILAYQHYEAFNNILAEFDIRCDIITSSVSKKEKELKLEKLKKGEIDILIGTHALIEENVVFKNLGLVITDEQHRFGVRQRKLLSNKGENPDVLIMTATPIPRTLALILYGDLDISIIDELPPNRKKIETFAATRNMEDRINQFVKNQITEGRQIYIVCPLVEESEEIEAKSVLEIFEKYKNEIFNEYKVEYLHGKMRPKEKDKIMQEFKDGNIDILVATTVIEVGINVPNASVMIIQNAERFGLAQLHQLRGRVGRGKYKSFCILRYDSNSKLVKERMNVMCTSDDGFVISEKDLELRGPGEFFGTRQHGIPEFKIANLFTDINILKRANDCAVKIIKEDPNLEKEDNNRLKSKIIYKFRDNVEM